jgi:hypothetical protein
VDSAAGTVLGVTLGEYFVQRCGAAAATYIPRKFDGALFPTPPGVPLDDGDFHWQVIIDAMIPAPAKPYVTLAAAKPVQPSNLLNWLWGKAITEWKQ